VFPPVVTETRDDQKDTGCGLFGWGMLLKAVASWTKDTRIKSSLQLNEFPYH